MSDATFWDARVRLAGHTGWTNPIIYSFDQMARLDAVRRIIGTLNITKGRALDYGTGSGDFSQMLSNEFDEVYGYDISADVIAIAKQRARNLSNINFICNERVSQSKLREDSIDLILCVTVLDHIKEDDELNKIIEHFNYLLNKNGYLVIFEYAPSIKVKTDCHYERLSSFDEWQNLFKKHGFDSIKSFGFYHPKIMPCDSYISYTSNLRIKFLWLLIRVFKINSFPTWLKRHVDAIASNHLNYQDYFWQNKDNDIIKIMIFSKGLK